MAIDFIETHRLNLRRLAIDDAADLYPIFADPLTMRFFSDPHRTFSERETWVRQSLAAPPSQTREFVLEYAGSVIGKAGIWDAPEIGFLLHRTYWGRGLMAEALPALLPHFFRHMSLDKITADVDSRNTACLRLLNRLGFRQMHQARRTILISGEWCDSLYLALNAPDAAL